MTNFDRICLIFITSAVLTSGYCAFGVKFTFITMFTYFGFVIMESFMNKDKKNGRT